MPAFGLGRAHNVTICALGAVPPTRGRKAAKACLAGVAAFRLAMRMGALSGGGAERVARNANPLGRPTTSSGSERIS